MKKSIICVVLSLIMLTAVFLPCGAEKGHYLAVDAAALELNCVSAVLMEASTGVILFEKNADEALPPASVTKIMTLLIVMEAIEAGALSWEDTVTASANATSMGGSQIFLKEGEQMSVEEMVKSVVISSANDAALALAEHIAGSEEVFVARMNARAAELGMNNTNFENTNGLDDTVQNHVTSARDIAIMSRELIKHEKILQYSSIWMDTIRNGAFGLTNTNRLVRFYKGCTGLKTGSTSKAKFCISATAKREEMTLIAVIMASPSRDERNAAAKTLLDWGFANFALYRSDVELPESIKLVGGKNDACRIYTEEFSAVVRRGTQGKVKAEITLPEKVTAPLTADEIIGEIKYTVDGEEIGKSTVKSVETMEKIGYLGIVAHIVAYFLLKK